MKPRWPRWGKKVAAEPECYEFHHQDETHADTNPHLCRMDHRIGQQPTLPAAGTNRRVTIFGSADLLGRGRVEVVCAGQDSAHFLLSLAALDGRHEATGREIYLALDHASCHTSAVSRAALAERESWLHVLWFPKYSPNLNHKEQSPTSHMSFPSATTRVAAGRSGAVWAAA